MRMKREILFRGKRKDNDEWIEGSLLNFRENTYIIPHDSEYCYDDTEKLAFDVKYFEVLPETVGQFTGMSDVNGVKIFEGDIFKGYKIAGRRVNFVFWYDEDERAFMYGSVYKKGYRLSISKYCISIKESEIEIIGNIHDNPEVLGGGENATD